MNNGVTWASCEEVGGESTDGAMVSASLVSQAGADPTWSEGLNSNDPREVKEYGQELAYEVGACAYDAGRRSVNSMRWGYVGAGAALGAGLMYFFSKVRR